ncbi:MAG: cobyrinate a,c-diamide synthase [Chloroflexi bacterium]|nr:cobyrinate a,c-diamide synthase [Chloroflexota bacterium]
MEAPRLVVGGVRSGVGKTTLACGIMAAMRRRGLTVQPFKIGSDYIDPGYLTAAAQRAARGLDAWLAPATALPELFGRALQSSAAKLAVIEGDRGLFDGVGVSGEAGSTAEAAKLLAAPILLAVEGEASPRSIAATVLGFQRFDPQAPLAGVLVTGLTGPEHLGAIAEAVGRATNLPVLGGLPRRADLRGIERRLGAAPAADEPELDALIERLADAVEQWVDLDSLLELARSAPPVRLPAVGVYPAAPVARVRIALALDEAFNIYVHDNLDLLAAWGAELVPFSPLRDTQLPPGVGAVYLGGGFPEVYAEALAANTALMDALRERADEGLPIYAEGGGMTYLSEAVVTPDGTVYPMVGIVPGVSELDGQPPYAGYATVQTRRPTLLGPVALELRAYEHHWSHLAPSPGEATAAYTVREQPERLEGFAWGGVLASHFHLHFAAHPVLARTFVLSAEKHLRGA